MKLSTIALAGALVMSSNLAFAQMGGGNGEGATLPENSARNGQRYDAQGDAVRGSSMEHRTTGMGQGPKYSTVPGGDPAGPSSLSGSGPSTFGGNSPSVVK
jgi:hypothetical protein